MITKTRSVLRDLYESVLDIVGGFYLVFVFVVLLPLLRIGYILGSYIAVGLRSCFSRKDFQAQILDFLGTHQTTDSDGMLVRPYVVRTEYCRPIGVAVTFSMCAEGENPNTSRYLEDGKVRSHNPDYTPGDSTITTLGMKSGVKYRGLPSYTLVFETILPLRWSIRNFKRDLESFLFKDRDFFETIIRKYDNDEEDDADCLYRR